MKSPSSSIRLFMVACAILMVAGQLMGLHFHRHVAGADADAGHGHGMSLHLRDAGVHSHATAGVLDHHSIDDRAAHPDVDVEIEPLAAGLAKVVKVWVAAGLLVLALLWCCGMGWSVLQRVARPAARRHPPLFVLRPPSMAPPLELSLVR